MLRAVPSAAPRLLAAALLAATAGCVDEEIVYRDRALFAELDPAAGSFLGYFDVAEGLTTCGNCHIGVQAEWEGSRHAGAWATLVESGHRAEVGYCDACHTVSQLGNPATEPVGYETVPVERYHDVQCESCHGAGLNHVENPDASQPLASMAVGLDLTQGCGECHQGNHHAFVEEWSQSGHGTVVTRAADNPACESCHSGEGALAAWGLDVSYQEEGTLDGPGQHLAITCAVCHDPHGSPNTAQLRFPVDVANEERNLCMKCHHKRGTPDPTTFRGPHSPQGPLLLGTAGWWPPALDFEGPIVATHGSERNPTLCAGCHVNSFPVTDAETGEFQFQATGHLFEAIPCLGGDGIPQAGGDCALEERTFQTCTSVGCHGLESTARQLLVNAENRILGLADDLDALLVQVPASEFDDTDTRYTVAEGSRFNEQLAREAGTAVHNPVLIEALLVASISEVQEEYGVSTAAHLRLERLLGRGATVRR